jgi:DsbC/DsbD-like thiol-disulfide interchange protein
LSKYLGKFFLFWGMLPATLYAGQGPLVKNGPVTTRLVSEKSISPQAKTFQLGWWIKREKGWHTYWESPGDVGVPPTINWNLPDGVVFREMQYAPPQLVKMFKVFAHGHKDETLFICTFDLKRKLNPGDQLTFQGNASWLACYTTCLPTYDQLEITIPVENESKIDDRWHSYFQDFLKEQPISPPSDWISLCNAEIRKDKKGEKEFVIFKFPWDESGPLPTFRFFGEGRFIRSNIFQIPQKHSGANGRGLLEISMELSYWRDPKQTQLEGLLYCADGWTSANSKFYKISVPIM